VVYLVHHADAAGPDVDAQRSLSPSGRLHADWLAAQAAERGVKPIAIWHSGKLRARQTAEPFWHVCNPLAEFAAIRGLQPMDPPEWIKDRLTGELRDIMLVGHMPSLPAIYRLLLGDRGHEAPSFPLHGFVALEPEREFWRERWRLGPPGP
jgi:phosphohistidine phosphatase